jgi:type VI secretion system protein ImpC
MEFEIGMAKGGQPRRVETSPFIIMVLGDFSAHTGHPAELDPAQLVNLPLRKVDADNMDDLWSDFKPRLGLQIGNSEVLIEPRDLDDFHPDQLFMKLPLFGELRNLRKRLLDASTSAEALAEVMASSPAPEAGSFEQKPDKAAASPENGDAMFDRLLGGRRTAETPTDAALSGIDNLIQNVVGPHIVHEPDPRVETAVDAIDAAIAETMRKILHHPDFQQLEGDWRALFDLVYDTESGEELVIKVANASKATLQAGMPESADSLGDSGLYELLVGRFRRAADDEGFSVLACQYRFGGSIEDVALLATLASLAEHHGAAVLGTAEDELIGTPALHTQPTASDWSSADNPFWQQLRESPTANRIGLAMPRILGRLPYGNAGEEVDHFEFEELRGGAHEDFLWVNPTLACAKLLAQNFTLNGWSMRPGAHNDIGGLPAYSYSEDGESKMLPCAELLLPERSAEEMLQRGIMPIVSFRNHDMARLLRFQGISEPLAALKGPWEG